MPARLDHYELITQITHCSCGREYRHYELLEVNYIGNSTFHWHLAKPGALLYSFEVRYETRTASTRACIECIETVAKEPVENYRPPYAVVGGGVRSRPQLSPKPGDINLDELDLS